MGQQNNPSLGPNSAVRHGPLTGSSWKSHGHPTAVNQSAPTSDAQCLPCGTAVHIEVAVKAPVGSTCTLIYGRWVTSNKPADIGEFIETGRRVLLGGGIVPIHAGGDKVGAYIDAISGIDPATETIAMAYRQSGHLHPE